MVDGNCADGKDNDCNGLTDGNDVTKCVEGSGLTTLSNTRNCNDAVQNDAWADMPETLIDANDFGCCDKCSGNNIVFDTTYLGKDINSNVGVPGTSCGTIKISDWQSGTKPYCCGNIEDANEFLKINPQDPTIMACCNDSSHCVGMNSDGTYSCQIGVEETLGLCTNGKDDDCDGLIDGADTNCSGTITGYVFDENKNLLRDATIKVSSQEASFEVNTTTDFWGAYAINATLGNNNIIARKQGYDDNVTNITVLSRTLSPNGIQINLTLRNGSCHQDCTDSYNNCNSICEGLTFMINTTTNNTCNMVQPLSLCDKRPKGYRATYKDNNNIIHEYICCEGENTTQGITGERNYTAIKPTITGTAQNLYDQVFIVKLMNRTARMHILITN